MMIFGPHQLLISAIYLIAVGKVHCFSFHDVSERMMMTRHPHHGILKSQLYAATTDLEERAFELVEPVKDNSYSKNPIKRIRHLVTNLGSNDEQTIVHEKSLAQTGGVWKTTFLGKPAYGVSAYIPEITNNLTKLEAQGYLTTNWPDSVLDVLGRSSFIAATPVSDYGRKIFSEAMATRNILSQSLSGIEETVNRMLDHWNKCAETGEITTFATDVSSITYEVIATAVFGPGALSEDEMKTLRKCADNIAKGIFSIPIDKPIIRHLPFLRRYHLAMTARSEMAKLLLEKIDNRKAIISKNGDNHKPVGMLDAFLLEGGLKGDDLVNFCVDNVVLSIFAGYDTTASVSTNLILLLHEYATKDELEQIRLELNSFDIKSFNSSSAVPALGMLECVPSLKSAVYESFRFRPVVGSTFRKTTKPIRLGNVEFPANTTIQWSHLHGNESPTFFEGITERPACPLRFRSSNEPPPFMFGYGKHKCPGQFLAQIEMVLVMKAFLCNFDFALIPDQDTKPTIPFQTPKSGLQLKLTKRQ